MGKNNYLAKQQEEKQFYLSVGEQTGAFLREKMGLKKEDYDCKKG